MINEGEPNRGDERMYDQGFASGFTEGFSRAREIFWRDFMRKAGDAHLMGELLVGTPAEDIEEAKKFALMEVVYKSVADTIAKSHNVYPGAVAPNTDLSSADNPDTTLKYNNLFRY